MKLNVKIVFGLLIALIWFSCPVYVQAQNTSDSSQTASPADSADINNDLLIDEEDDKKEKKSQFEEFLDYEIFKYGGYRFTLYRLFLLLIIFVGVQLTVRLIQGIVKRRLEQKKVFNEGRSGSLIQLVKYVVYVLAFAMALHSLGFNVGVVLLSSATLLFGIGLGLQEMFKDIASGIAILVEQNVKVGDIVEISGLLGKVREVKLRTSELETRDGTYVIVPNSKFINDQVINWSHNYVKTRFHVSVGVAYGSDVEKVREILLDVAKNNKDIMDLPGPFVTFENFGNSSLDFYLYFWSRRIWESEVLESDVRFAISHAFKKHGIQIPFPQLDLHFKNNAHIIMNKDQQID